VLHADRASALAAAAASRKLRFFIAFSVAVERRGPPRAI